MQERVGAAERDAHRPALPQPSHYDWLACCRATYRGTEGALPSNVQLSAKASTSSTDARVSCSGRNAGGADQRWQKYEHAANERAHPPGLLRRTSVRPTTRTRVPTLHACTSSTRREPEVPSEEIEERRCLANTAAPATSTTPSSSAPASAASPPHVPSSKRATKSSSSRRRSASVAGSRPHIYLPTKNSRSTSVASGSARCTRK